MSVMCLSDGSHWPAITAEYQKKKVYADIRRGSLEMRRQTTVGKSKTSIFSAFGCYVFGTLGNEANSIT